MNGCSQCLVEMLLVVITIADWMSRLLITSEQLDWRKILSCGWTMNTAKDPFLEGVVLAPVGVFVDL